MFVFKCFIVQKLFQDISSEINKGLHLKTTTYTNLIKYNSYDTLYGKEAHMELKVYLIFLYSFIKFF